MRHRRFAPALPVLTVLALAACDTDVGLPTFQADLNEVFRDEARLTELCQRPIAETEANAVRVTMQAKPAAQPGELSFAGFVSKRGMFGKEGKGSSEVLYIPQEGAPCVGSMTFSFVQETSSEKVGKRGMKYKSEITFKDLVLTTKQ